MAILREKYIVKLHDTDAAGVLFYANQFRIIHDSYQSFLKKIGIDFKEMFEAGDFFIPIVHAEADFKKPMKVGDGIETELTVSNIGNSSFALDYTITDNKGNIVGTAKTVHVTCDSKSMKKITLPPEIKNGLNKFRSE